MEGIQFFYVALASFGGAVFGALVGWLKNKEADPATPFKWYSFLLACLLGLFGAVVYAFGLVEAFTWQNLVLSFLAGTGLAYAVPKTAAAIKG